MPSRFLPSLYTSRGMSGDPFYSLHQEMNRLFDDAFRALGVAGPAGGAGTAGAGAVAMPRLDVHETDKEVCITVEVPGVQSSDLDVRLDGDVLTISGEKKDERETQQERYHVMERSFGRFARSVRLPFEPQAEQVQADFKDGVLTLRLPRQPQQERSRRIEVRSSGEPARLSEGGQPAQGQRQGQLGGSEPAWLAEGGQAQGGQRQDRGGNGGQPAGSDMTPP